MEIYIMERVAENLKINKIEFFYWYKFIFSLHYFLGSYSTSFEAITLIKNRILFNVKCYNLWHFIVFDQGNQFFILSWGDFVFFLINNFVFKIYTVLFDVICTLKFLFESIWFVQTEGVFVKKWLNFILN